MSERDCDAVERLWPLLSRLVSDGDYNRSPVCEDEARRIVAELLKAISAPERAANEVSVHDFLDRRRG